MTSGAPGGLGVVVVAPSMTTETVASRRHAEGVGIVAPEAPLVPLDAVRTGSLLVTRDAPRSAEAVRAMAGLALGVLGPAIASCPDLRAMTRAAAKPPVSLLLVGRVATAASVLAPTSLAHLLSMAAVAPALGLGRSVTRVALLAGADVRAIGRDLVATLAGLGVRGEAVGLVAGVTAPMFGRFGLGDESGLLVAPFAAAAPASAFMRAMARNALLAVTGPGSSQSRPGAGVAFGAWLGALPASVWIVARRAGAVLSSRTLLMTLLARDPVRAGNVRGMAVGALGVGLGLPTRDPVALILVALATAARIGLELVRHVAIGASGVRRGKQGPTRI